MNNIHFIYSLDETTIFLNVFQENFDRNFYVIEPNKKSVEESINFASNIPEKDIVVFLGHGHSTGLYTPESKEFNKNIFISSKNGNVLFKKKKVLLLSCNSNQFISRLNTYDSIIGFGNIISSLAEVSIEAENVTGVYREINKDDIDYFNACYCAAIIKSLKLVSQNLYNFEEIPQLIEFNLNHNIGTLLKNKSIINRTEIAKLFFEFRNEILIKKT